MRQILVIGDTGNELVSKFNSNFAGIDQLTNFNVEGYGAVHDGVTDDTDAIKAAIADAEVNGGIVFFPAGIYLTHTLNFSEKVKLKGVGRETILKSISAEPLLTCLSPEANTWAGWWIDNIKLDGNNIGTIGMSLSRLSSYIIQGVYITNFTNYGIYATGLLIGSIYDCYFSNLPVGYHNYSSLTPTAMSCNANLISRCSFALCSSWAIDWNSGQLLAIENCVIEGNGTQDNNQTGCIRFIASNRVSNVRSVGLRLTNCWFEYNYGTIISIRSWIQNANLNNVIDNCVIMLNGNNPVIDLYSQYDTECILKIRDSSITGYIALQIDGNNTKIINDNSHIYGTISKIDGGTYYIVDNTLVT